MADGGRKREAMPEPADDAPDTPQARLGRELLRIRKTHSLSQDRIAARLFIGGYSPGGKSVSTARATISLFENGKRIPSDEVIERYAELGAAADRELLRQLVAVARTDQRAASDPVRVDAPEGPTWQERRSRRLRPRGRTAFWSAGALIVVAAVMALVVVYWLADDSPDDRQGPGSTWTETTGTPAHTWSDSSIAGGKAGPPLGPRQSIQISCRLRGYVVQDGDPWWYRISSAPWNGDFYATSDAFYNNGATSGRVDDGVVVDEQVPECGG